MSGLYEELVYRIRGEVSDLDRLVQKALRVWSRVQKPENEQDIFGLHCLESPWFLFRT